MSEDVLQQLMLWCVNSYYMPVQKATIMWEHDCLDLVPPPYDPETRMKIKSSKQSTF